MKKAFSLCFIFLFPLWLLAQNTIGLPEIVNYLRSDYKAGAQNRQVRQDRSGRLYFANNDGLLIYDGISWRIYPLPNKTIIRSLQFGPDNKLYVGGQDEFGYFSPKKNGELVFNSLRDMIPQADRSFTDVWDIYFHKDLIFFHTSTAIYQFDGRNCTVYKSRHWRFIGQCNNQLFAQDYDKGLLQFKDGLWSPFLKNSDLPADYFATSLTSVNKDSILLTTLKNGVYIIAGGEAKQLQNPFLNSVSNKNISASTMVNDNHIAIATNLAGCFIIDKKGNLVQSFSRKEGLQNNNVLDVYLDKEKNLWLGLDNGIDFIAYNNSIKHIYSDYLNEGSGYAARIFNQDLYIGTSNGLFKVKLDDGDDISFIKGNFTPVSNSGGQVWNLSEVNGRLLMGHHDGAFDIKNNEAIAIDRSDGYWTFQPYSSVLPSSLMVSGTYQGLSFFNYQSGTFSKANIDAKFESARFVVMDNGHIWVAHPYKGIFRVHLNNNSPVVKSYTAKEGVQSPNGNFIFKIRNRIVLTTEKGIFEYNNEKDKFETSGHYNKLFPNKGIRYLKDDNAGNTWFVFDKIIGVIDNSSTQPALVYFPELTDKFVSGFEFVYPINNKNVLVGGEKGFYHINYEQYKTIKYDLQPRVTLVKAFNERDSLLFGGFASELNDTALNSETEQLRISHAWNSFHFSFAASAYAQKSNIQYSYFLEGFDEKWSEFSDKTEKEYTNIPAGNYVFNVKARNNLGNESEAGTYSFVVLPPWYKSYWAYFLYFFAIAITGYLLLKHQRKKFLLQQQKYEEEQKRLQYLHQLELDKNEKELVKLRNEKLEAEIAHKNTELASTAMHLVQKGELLGKVKDQMLKLKNSTINEADDVKKLLRRISDEDKMDEQWEHFSIHFDKVHSDFLRTLKSRYPTLSNNEMKLTAYLRMNLSTKEIAQLMNISVRGVEISRYRLRKKLEIPKEVTLFDFLIQATA